MATVLWHEFVVLFAVTSSRHEREGKGREREKIVFFVKRRQHRDAQTQTDSRSVSSRTGTEKQEDGKSESVREKERKAENGERITPWLA